MSNKDYSLQDLLNIVGETDSEKSPDHSQQDLSEIEQFIKDKNIINGVDRIPNYVLYFTYKRYGGLLAKVEFFRQFKKQGFTQRRTGKQRVYLLDASSFDMSREGLIEAEFHNKKRKK
tara:strand:- start:281 stop:634 length:354 start_codon:yes stop_codon:yes gene_type:complete